MDATWDYSCFFWVVIWQIHEKKIQESGELSWSHLQKVTYFCGRLIIRCCCFRCRRHFFFFKRTLWTFPAGFQHRCFSNDKVEDKPGITILPAAYVAVLLMLLCKLPFTKVFPKEPENNRPSNWGYHMKSHRRNCLRVKDSLKDWHFYTHLKCWNFNHHHFFPDAACSQHHLIQQKIKTPTLSRKHFLNTP